MAVNQHELWLGYDSADAAELAELSAIRDLLEQSSNSSTADERTAAKISVLKERLQWHYSSWWQLDALTRNQFEHNGRPMIEASENELRNIRILGTILERLQQIELQESNGRIPVIIRECNDELLRWLATHPEDMYALHPDTFERLVARVFEDQGYETTRISSWNQPDGGVDFLAVRKLSPGIDVRLAVQCKRNARENKVGVEPVRALMGVLDIAKAHEGVIATTGFFTRNVIEEVQKHFWRISLRDYDRIVQDLQLFGLLKHDETLRGA